MVKTYSASVLWFLFSLALWLGYPLAGSAQTQPDLFTAIYLFTNTVGDQAVHILVGPDDVLYGTTFAEGPQSGGAVFRMNRDGTGFATLASFTPAQTGNTNSVVYNFSNGQPGNDGYDFPFDPLLGGLNLTIGGDGYLYGTVLNAGTNNEGMVFKQTRAYATGQNPGLTDLHSFGAADANPLNVIQGADGALYGTTLKGGSYNDGVIFRLASDGSSYSVLYNFSPATDGQNCSSLFQGGNGYLYGSLEVGTNNFGGTIFTINTNGDNYTVLTNMPFTFADFPLCLIQDSDGFLYGTVPTGVFQLKTDGSGLKMIHTFSGTDGQDPVGLVQGLNGAIYGTTTSGGTNSSFPDGVIYQITQSGANFSPIFYLTGTNNFITNGAIPLTLAVGSFSGTGGVLYGTTARIGTGTGPALQYQATNGIAFSLVVNPPLTITPATSTVNGQTTVFWPAWAQNYTLQSTTNLTTPTWSNVTSGNQVVGVQVTNSPSTPNVFYRLVYP